jgi:diadenosine tetraphosphatase ApaH/serine/threonine PP2A family protein phosphatase
MGNHDAAACGLEEPTDFNPVAKEALLWTRRALKPEHRDALKGLPEQMTLTDGFRLAHGSLLYRDHYLSSHDDIMENIRLMRAADPEIRVLFFGHTHNQVAFRYAESTLSLVAPPASRFSVRDGATYLINPGSVGQPRDQDPRCAFLLYDAAAGTVEACGVADCLQPRPAASARTRTAKTIPVAPAATRMAHCCRGNLPAVLLGIVTFTLLRPKYVSNLLHLGGAGKGAFIVSFGGLALYGLIYLMQKPRLPKLQTT